MEIKETIKMISFVLSIVILSTLFIWGFFCFLVWAYPADTRTIQQVKEDTYKRCVVNYNASRVELCANYLK